MFATIFNAIVSNSKHPYSPYGDKTYDFKVVEFETKYDFYVCCLNFCFKYKFRWQKSSISKKCSEKD
jgi:hypothetical protein